MQGGSPPDCGVLNYINRVQDADPRYLRLYHKTMQTNCHQYIELTSMRVEMLNNID